MSITYDLYIGDRTVSSWSLRGWLLLEKFRLDLQTHLVGLYGGTMAADMTHLAPAKLVPTPRMPDGTVVDESLAIAETLAKHHPDIAIWPADPAARWLCAEMASNFSELRGQCPMQLQHVNKGFSVNAGLLADLDRLERLWAHGAKFKSVGPWLFGGYSIADCMFAPVAVAIQNHFLRIQPLATNAQSRGGPKIEPFHFRSAWSMEHGALFSPSIQMHGAYC